MEKRHLRWAATVTSLILIGGPSGAADRRGPILVLHVIDHTDTSSMIMAQARSHAERVFGAIGVHVAWSDGTGGPCGDLDLFVTLLSTDGVEEAPSTGEMGENLVGWASRADARAFVYPDRVRALALRTRRSPGVMLGRVIAHEVGHLTLASGHSRSGIMSQGIDSRPTSMWALFTPEQGRTIRALLGSKAGDAVDREGCGI